MSFSRKILAAAALCAPLAVLAAPSGATSLDPLFALTPDVNVYDSATVAHTTVRGTLASSGDVAWYSFTGQQGQQFFADHDDDINGDTLTDSVLSLFDASGQLLAMGDDSDFDPGSRNDGGIYSFNAFLGAYTLPTTGVYYLALSALGNGADDSSCDKNLMLLQPGSSRDGGAAYSGCGIDFALANGGTTDGSFTLHVSLAAGVGAAVPEPSSLALAGLALAGLVARRRRG